MLNTYNDYKLKKHRSLKPLRFFDKSNMGFFTLRELISLIRLVCKGWNELILHYRFPYYNIFVNYVFIIDGIKGLRSELLRELALSSKKPLYYIEETRGIGQLPNPFIRLRLHQQVQKLSLRKQQLFYTVQGLYAIRFDLIPPELAAKISEDNLEIFISKYGLKAIQEGLITITLNPIDPETYACLLPRENLRLILTRLGLEALRNHFRPHQLYGIDPAMLGLLLTDGYREFMLRTPQNEKFLIPNGMEALESGTMTLELASRIEINHLLCLLTQNGIEAQQEGVFDAYQADILPIQVLIDLISDEGYGDLSRGLISLEVCNHETTLPHTDEYLEQRLNELIALTTQQKTASCCNLQ